LAVSARTGLRRDSVPIEGMGFGIQTNAVLRRAGLTSVEKVRDLLAGNEVGLRILDANEGHRAFLRSRFVRQDLRAQLAVFDKNGPLPFITLTRLETQILYLFVEGHSDKTISVQLGVSENMVKVRLKSLIRKMKGRFAPYDD
jgi:DNA-binding NarL/FixJ family response regulator